MLAKPIVAKPSVVLFAALVCGCQIIVVKPGDSGTTPDDTTANEVTHESGWLDSGFQPGESGDSGTLVHTGDTGAKKVNTPPSAPEVLVEPDRANSLSELECTISTESVDAEGDTVSYSYAWSSDSSSSTESSYKLSASETVAGDTWTCTVTPSDGTQDGESASDSVEIEPIWVAVSTGYKHSCAIDEWGVLECWGADTFGQATPPTGYTWSSVVAGFANSCGIELGGTLLCWGDPSSSLSRPPSGSYEGFDLGINHGCAFDGAGTTECWGDVSAFSPSDETVVSLADGYAHGCAVTDRASIVCYGDDSDNTSGELDAPTALAVMVSSRHRHTCALLEDLSVSCWGLDTDDSTLDIRGPLEKVSVGWYHNCALDSTGAAECWGSDSAGRTSPPKKVAFTEISAGGAHSCGVTTRGDLMCFGDDSYGQSSPP
jgi:hypothetical protein